MEKQEILQKVIADFQFVFKDDSEIDMDTKFTDIDSWDSMGFIMFLNKLQETFNVKFPMADFVSMHTIGQIVDAIERITK